MAGMEELKNVVREPNVVELKPWKSIHDTIKEPMVTGLGTVDIPDFGFYKLEMKRPEETTWLTILAGNQIRQGETLGIWNTSLLPPGYHQLGLVVTDNQGKILAPCITQVRVTNPEVTP